jgi:hypothetical protein
MACWWSERILTFHSEIEQFVSGIHISSVDSNPIKISKGAQYGWNGGQYWAPIPNSCTVVGSIITDNMASKNNGISSWDSLYMELGGT